MKKKEPKYNRLAVSVILFEFFAYSVEFVIFYDILNLSIKPVGRVPTAFLIKS